MKCNTETEREIHINHTTTNPQAIREHLVLHLEVEKLEELQNPQYEFPGVDLYETISPEEQES